MAGKPNDKMFKTMVKKHGSDEAARAWFRAVGRRGGLAKVPKGFALNPKLASLSGAKGGRISKRKPKEKQ